MKKHLLSTCVVAGFIIAYLLVMNTEDNTHLAVSSEKPTTETDTQSVVRTMEREALSSEKLVFEITNSTDPNDIYTGPTDTTNSFLEDVRATYFDNIARATEGDGESAFRVHNALNVCNALNTTISALGGIENYTQRSQSVGLDIRRSPVLDCQDIYKSLPKGKKFGEESDYWLDIAANDAFGPAQLVKEWPKHNLSESAYLSAARMLERNISSGEPIVYQYVVKFYQQFHHPDGKDLNLKEVFKWEYLTCEAVSTCQSRNLMSYWEQEYGLLAWEQDEISEFPKSVEQTLSRNGKFNFSDSWLPMHKHRAETPDGIDYSEYIED